MHKITTKIPILTFVWQNNALTSGFSTISDGRHGITEIAVALQRPLASTIGQLEIHLNFVQLLTRTLKMM